MKREFLEGLKLEKDTIDAIMAENGKDIEREKAKTEEEKTQKDLLDRQLKEATSHKKSPGIHMPGNLFYSLTIR